MAEPKRCEAVDRGTGLQCELDAGHTVDSPAEVSYGVTWEPAIPATPHRVTIEWEDDDA